MKMKVVFFEGTTWLTSSAKDHGMKPIGEKINDFLNCHPDIKIHHVKQSTVTKGDNENIDGVICISIWYTE